MALAEVFDAPPRAPADPIAAAKQAGLRYVCDSGKGYRRRRVGKSFAYYRPDGTLERDPDVILRLKRLAIPPAWTDVWICPDARGHIQASARDDKGRKQYRYHVDWRAHRDEAKFHRMPWFGSVLPEMREKISSDLASRDPQTRVCAAVAEFLDLGALRIGSKANDEATGASTLAKRHITVEGAAIHLHFKGKHGVLQDVVVTDRRLARVVKGLADLPGQSLFQIKQGDSVRPVTSTEVNAYLREIAGAYVTAKEFRTWAAGAAATAAMLEPEATISVKSVLAAASARLGNTPAVCRKSYVHPRLIELALNHQPLEPQAPSPGLNVPETTFLKLIDR